MNERKVTLPSGGVAYVVDVISHRDAMVFKKHYARLRRYMGPARDLDGGQTLVYRPDLTSEEMDARDDLEISIEALYVRTLTRRWENVKSADGQPIDFPDGIDEMREDDLQVLVAATTGAGRADPNAGQPSEPSPPPASTPTTPS